MTNKKAKAGAHRFATGAGRDGGGKPAGGVGAPSLEADEPKALQELVDEAAAVAGLLPLDLASGKRMPATMRRAVRARRELTFAEVVEVAAAYGYQLDLTWSVLGATALNLFCQRLVDEVYPTRAAETSAAAAILADLDIQAELVKATPGAARTALPRWV